MLRPLARRGGRALHVRLGRRQRARRRARPGAHHAHRRRELPRAGAGRARRARARRLDRARRRARDRAAATASAATVRLGDGPLRDRRRRRDGARRNPDATCGALASSLPTRRRAHVDRRTARSGRADVRAAARRLPRDAHDPRVRGAPAPWSSRPGRSPASCTSTRARRRSPPASCAHLGAGRLRRQHAPRPRPRDRQGLRREGDDGRDLRQARQASATARAARCTSPTSSKGMLGANGIVGGGPPLVCGVGLTAKVKRHRPGRGLVHRRRRLQPGHVPREPQPRLGVAPAVRVRDREQRLRGVDVAELPPGRASTSPSAPTASACPGVRRRRLRLLRRPRGGRRGDRTRPQRRRST